MVDGRDDVYDDDATTERVRRQKIDNGTEQNNTGYAAVTIAQKEEEIQHK